MRKESHGRRGASRLFAIYAAASLAPVVALGVVLGAAYRADGTKSGLAEARSQADLLSDDAVAPALGVTPLRASLPDGASERLSSAFDRAKSDGRLLRMRVRDLSGAVVWSDDGSGMVETSPTPGEQAEASGDEDEVAAALRGHVVSRLTNLNADANDSGPLGPRVVEIYRPIMADAAANAPMIGVLEMYVPYAPIEADVTAGLHRMYALLAIGLGVLWLVLAIISVSTTRRLRKQSRRLAYLAHYDDAFGMLNRVGFSDELAQRLRDAQARPPALALVNVSRFREINEALGRSSGDEVLRQLGRRLVAAAGESAVVSRLGGDEFGVACFAGECAIGDIDTWAENLQTAASEPIEAGGVPVLVEVAVGYDRGEDGQSVEALLNRADAALVRAKSAIDQRARFSPSIGHSDASSLALLARLRDSIPNGDLELHYQPKTALDDGRVVSVEALVRWRLDGKLLGPQAFLPSAEQTALIHPLTDWVAAEALRQLRDWGAAAEDVSMAINVSARNLSDPAFAGRLLTIVRESGADPRRLTVEITETALLVDPDAARQSLAAIHDEGISVSIDDFGQGQTSLAYLASLPVDELKIDRAFVAKVCTDPMHDAIVRSVVQLGHSLGLDIVAEGIEDAATIEHIADLGADVGQGYFIARPMRADAFEAWRGAREQIGARLSG